MRKHPKKTSKTTEINDNAKIEQWLKNKKNKVKKIPMNVSGECVMKGFFAKRKKNPFKKSTKTNTVSNAE